MNSVSIRVKLTTWYSLILAASLCLFSGLAYFAMSHSIRTTLDSDLKERLVGVHDIIAATAPEGLPELVDELREFAEVRAAGDLLRVSDSHGNVIYSSFGAADDAAAASLDVSKTLIFPKKIQGRHFRILSSTIEAAGSPYRVQVAVSVQQFGHALEMFRFMLYIATPVFLLLAALGGYLLSRRALAPVDQITQAARTIGAQNLTQRLAVPATGDELERLARTLNEMLARLEAAFRRIAQFTADASHELRTPVSVVRTSSELALSKERTPEEYRESLSQILAESEKMSHLIEELLALARSDSGAVTLPRSRIDLKEPFQKACRRASILAEAKRLKFNQRVREQPLWVEGDAPALERLFLILLDNAVKYTPPGGRIEAGLTRENGNALAEVRDAGIGISAEDLPHVFDRFYRTDRARSRETGGSGLGLAIGQWIAEAHDAKIHVESEPAKGSSFQVRIPLASD